MADAPKPTELDIFRPLIEHCPAELKAEADGWREFTESLGVSRECETHDDDNPCTIKGCLQLRAFRRYINAHMTARAKRLWHKREKKKAALEYFKKLELAFAPERFDHGDVRRKAKIAAVRKEADRDYQLLGLFNHYQEYLEGKGPKPEVY